MNASTSNDYQTDCRSNWYAWLVCISGALYFFFEFAQMNMFNAIDDSLMREFAIPAGQLGHISAYYFYANVLTLAPAGILLDRLSTRKLLLSAMCLTLVSLLAFAYAQSVLLLKAARFIMGATSSFCFLANVRLATRWFPPHKLARVIGVVVTIAMLGGVSVQMPLTYFTDLWGWRHALAFYMGTTGLIILVMLFLFVQDAPQGMQAKLAEQKQHLQSYGFWHSITRVLATPQNWLSGIFTSLMNLPIILLGAMWGLPYLIKVFDLTRFQASQITTMIFIGTIIGSPLIGWVSDTIGRRRALMVTCSLLSLFVILMAMYSDHNTYGSLLILYLLLGFFTSAQVLSYPVIAESNPPELTATSESLASIIIQGGGLTQPLFGWIMGIHWSMAVQHAPDQYSVGDFQTAMMVIPAGFFIALVASLCLRETHAKVLPQAHELNEDNP